MLLQQIKQRSHQQEFPVDFHSETTCPRVDSGQNTGAIVEKLPTVIFASGTSIRIRETHYLEKLNNIIVMLTVFKK